MYESLKFLCARIARALSSSQQSELERYIVSKSPQSPGELEALIREYDRRDKAVFPEVWQSGRMRQP